MGLPFSGAGFSSLGDALAWLDGHQNLERMVASVSAGRPVVPDLARMRALVAALGDPQHCAPVIHVTGTNGKTSTARSLTSLLTAKGLRVGMFTSPHLEVLNERIATDGAPISDADLLDALSTVGAVEELVVSARRGASGGGPVPGGSVPGGEVVGGEGLGASAGEALGALAGEALAGDVPAALDGGLTWFEILAAAAFVHFADRPVDVMVLEVGMGGRWDATNVADATVAVVTNVGLDHIEFLGPTRADVAGEKAGIVKPGSVLILGESDPELFPIFEREDPALLWLAGREFGCYRNELAVGGRALDLRTPGANFDGVWLDLHGSHQGRNFAAALAAAEAFFGVPLDDRLVREAAATVSSPGRLEIVGHDPLVVLDGAKNLEGAAAASAAVLEEFGSARSVILAVGMLAGGGKPPAAMLSALGAGRARVVIACPAPSPRTVPPAEVAEAARAVGAPEVVEVDSVPAALEAAGALATADDLILVTGSLYVVGAARHVLAGGA